MALVGYISKLGCRNHKGWCKTPKVLSSIKCLSLQSEWIKCQKTLSQLLRSVDQCRLHSQTHNIHFCVQHCMFLLQGRARMVRKRMRTETRVLFPGWTSLVAGCLMHRLLVVRFFFILNTPPLKKADVVKHQSWSLETVQNLLNFESISTSQLDYISGWRFPFICRWPVGTGQKPEQRPPEVRQTPSRGLYAVHNAVWRVVPKRYRERQIFVCRCAGLSISKNIQQTLGKLKSKLFGDQKFPAEILQNYICVCINRENEHSCCVPIGVKSAKPEFLCCVRNPVVASSPLPCVSKMLSLVIGDITMCSAYLSERQGERRVEGGIFLTNISETASFSCVWFPWQAHHCLDVCVSFLGWHPLHLWCFMLSSFNHTKVSVWHPQSIRIVSKKESCRRADWTTNMRASLPPEYSEKKWKGKNVFLFVEMPCKNDGPLVSVGVYNIIVLDAHGSYCRVKMDKMPTLEHCSHKLQAKSLQFR